MTRVAILYVVAVMPLISGCGTFADAIAGPDDDHLYYRGVRLDIAAIKSGVPIMALDMPFSACVDTIMVPSIAYRQLTEPPGTKHKSVVQAGGEALVKSIATEVAIPATTEMMKTAAAEAERQQQAPVPPPP